MSNGLERRLEREKRIRRQAEQLLESKSRELFDANESLKDTLESLETKVKERTRELEEATVRAQEANHAKSAFLANMSHEIRTPMNGVIGMADMLANSNLSDDQALYARTILDSSNALLSVINDILDFSKIEAGRMQTSTAPFNLKKNAQEVFHLIAALGREKGVKVTHRYAASLPDCFQGDGGRIRQIIMNLAGNAVKFTAEGSVAIDVTGATRDGRTSLAIAVTDTGIGIPEKDADQNILRLRTSRQSHHAKI